MTKLGQMILDDGVERGTQQGKEQMSALTAKLLEENRLDDLKKATQDNEFWEKLSFSALFFLYKFHTYDYCQYHNSDG